LPRQERRCAAAERAEARRIADLALRRLGQIDDVLDRFVERPPRGSARQILRIMAAELLFGGAPPHAAVDLAVRLARQGRGTVRMSGLINAVGRRVAEQGATLVGRQDAARLNTPDWLWARLANDWGAATGRAIAEAHLAPAPHDLTPTNAADADPLARETGGTRLPGGSVRLPGRPQITSLPGYAQGAWWVQDAAAALPARLIPAPADKRVLDLCAAPGGKTLQLAAAGARVTALDVSETRMERLSQNLARTELDAEIVVADALDWRPDAPFDAILVDAPCSATGTIRRHPDLPHRFDPARIDGLARRQSEILDAAADWLVPGGRLVFCTCSLLIAEGEAMLDAFLADRPRAALDPIEPGEAIPPEFVDTRGRLRTRPDIWADGGGIDGFFAARIRLDA